MLHRLCFLFVASVLLLAPAASATSNDDSVSWPFEKTLVNAVYSRGRRQIMDANISPVCRQTALTALAEAAAADSQITCDTMTEKVEAFADIFLAVWESLGNLMDDVNTVVNGIPLCMSQYGVLNIPGRVSCFFTNFWPIWNAVKDVWHYQNFWMNPYQAVKDFSSCFNKVHSESTKNVKLIVNNAKVCN